MVNARAASKVFALVMLLAIAASVVIPSVPVYVAGEEDIEGLRARARLCQEMLQRAITAFNVSETLREEIEELLAVNISLLSAEELEQFIEKARGLMDRIREEAREQVRAEVRAKVLERLKVQLRNRLEKGIKSLFMTIANLNISFKK